MWRVILPAQTTAALTVDVTITSSANASMAIWAVIVVNVYVHLVTHGQILHQGLIKHTYQQNARTEAYVTERRAIVIAKPVLTVPRASVVSVHQIAISVESVSH